MVFGVATFYQLFTFEPAGDHTCTVCTGTACFVKGADASSRQWATQFGVRRDTTEDGLLTLKTARCLGSCGLAPIVLLDGEVIGKERRRPHPRQGARLRVAAEPAPQAGPEGSEG